VLVLENLDQLQNIELIMNKKVFKIVNILHTREEQDILLIIGQFQNMLFTLNMKIIMIPNIKLKIIQIKNLIKFLIHILQLK